MQKKLENLIYHVWMVFVKSNKFSPIPVISPVYNFVFVCGNNPHEWMPNKCKTLEILKCLILIQMMAVVRNIWVFLLSFPQNERKIY